MKIRLLPPRLNFAPAFRNILALYLASTLAISAHATEVPLQDARNLLKEGNPAAALDLLVPFEADHSGEAEFDYLLGIAALEAHKPDIAVFALERAAAVESKSAYVHADLARAYGELGERDAAKTELELAQRLSHEPQANAAIQRYLDALSRGEQQQPKLFSAFLEFTGGYDSNVNSATSDRQMGIPAFGGYTFSLSAKSLERSSNFVQAGGGIGLHYMWNDNTQLFARLSGTNRTYWQQSDYDTSTTDVSAGVSHRIGVHTLSIALQGYDFWLNEKNYRYTRGASGQWQMQLDPRTQIGAFVQIGKLTYPGTPIRNVDRYVGGLTVGHVLEVAHNPLVYASLYTGSEIPTHSGASFLGHHLQGIRLGGELALDERWTAHAGLGYEYRNYGGTDTLFLVGRADHQYEANAGLSYAAGHGVSLHPQLSYIRSDSNVALNRFDRMEVMLNVRKDF